MKQRNWYRTGSALAVTMTALTGMAQETAEPATKDNEVSLGYSSFKGYASNGQYARPVNGLALHRLSLFAKGSKEAPFGRLTLKGLGEQDNLIDGVLAFNGGKTTLRAQREQFGYSVHAWPALPLSGHDKTEVALNHSLQRGLGVFLNLGRTKRTVRYPAPRANDAVETRSVTAGVSGAALGGNVSASFSERHTTPNGGGLTETLQRSLALGYGAQLFPDFNLEGTARFTRVEQFGAPSSTAKAFGLNGDWNLGENTALQLRLGRQDLDMKGVTNARLQQRATTGARLVHRMGKFVAQVGYTHGETERVRTDQSFVDVPKSDTLDARLTGRVGSGQLALRGSYERVSDLPVMNTDDPRSLQWDRKGMFQGRFSNAFSDGAVYISYTNTFRQNSDRGVDLGWQCLTLGASRSFGPAFHGYLELQAEDFRLGGWADGGQAVDPYFPNLRSAVVGFEWVKDPSLTFAASLSHSESSDVRDTQLNLSMRKRCADGRDFELVYSPWRRDDRLYDLTGYRASFLMVRSTMRF